MQLIPPPPPPACCTNDELQWSWEVARIATDAVAFVAQQQRWQQREDSKAGRVLCRARAVAAEAGGDPSLQLHLYSVLSDPILQSEAAAATAPRNPQNGISTLI